MLVETGYKLVLFNGFQKGKHKANLEEELVQLRQELHNVSTNLVNRKFYNQIGKLSIKEEQQMSSVTISATGPPCEDQMP